MLDKINTIDWGSLEHAYGSASDVPDLLQALASDDYETWNEALGTLHSNIWHQYTVYEATVYAIPFLLELLTPPQSPKTFEILNFLKLLRNGTSYHDVHKHYFSDEDVRSESFQKKLAKELSDVQKVYDTIAEYIDVYISLLQADDQEIRSASIALLCTLKTEYDRVFPALREHLPHETSPIARSGILYGLSELSDEPNEVILDVLMDYTVDHVEPIERFSAAITTAHILEHETPDHVIEILFKAIEPDEKLREQYDDAFWIFDYHIEAVTGAALMAIGLDKVEAGIMALMDRLGGELYVPSIGVIVGVLINLVFETDQPLIDLNRRDITPLQYDVLTFIKQNALVIKDPQGRSIAVNGSVSSLLSQFGLPSRPDELQVFLEG